MKTAIETVQLVSELARMVPDHTIVRILNRLGIRSAKGQTWPQSRIANFRGSRHIAVYREGERAQRRKLILHEAASRLGVSNTTVMRLIRNGILPGKQVCSGAPNVIREEDLYLPAVRHAVEHGRPVLPELRQDSPSFQ